MTFRFDARDLVGPPFKSCPKCGSEEFGVYHTGPHQYSRRCRKCWHKGDFRLWPLSRKVIYIDQFAISNMMTALNPRHPRHAAAAANPFWVTLFERLDRVIKLQLVICPYSDVHRHESMVSGHYEPLKQMYEHLSHGVSFETIDTIAQRQLNTALLAWLRGEKPQHEFDAERVTSGGLNEWKERFIISVSGEYPAFIVNAVRKFRDEVHTKVRALFAEQLSPAKETDFEYWLEREERLGGQAILESARLYAERLADMMVGLVPFAFENIYTSKGWEDFNLMKQVLEGNGIPTNRVGATIREFVRSDAYKHYPANRISSLVWAAIDQAAALGQREPPNAGMTNDIQALTLMPFCDAMFVDNGCRGLWSKIPKRRRPPYPTKLFSYKTREKFFAYLDEIEAQADSFILSCVRDVYGEPHPFLTMYHERKRD